MSLQYGILGLLTYRDLSGYEIKTLFGKTISYIWEASLSQIYRELGKLENQALVKSSLVYQEGRPNKKVYSITQKGLSSFTDWLCEYPDKVISPKRDEFMLKIFFGSNLTHKQLLKQFENFHGGIKDYEKIVSGKQLSKTKKMIYGDNINRQSQTEELLWRFTVKRIEMTVRTLKEWSRECMTELERLDEKEKT